MNRWIFWLFLIGLTFSVACASPRPAGDNAPKAESGQSQTLIPRTILFGNPDHSAARLSRDGKYLSFLAPLDGVRNIWVAPLADPAAAKPVTHDKGRGIHQYFWTYTSGHLIFLQDEAGDENWRASVLNVNTGEIKGLTPPKGVRAEIEEVSHKFPEEILIALNNRNPTYHEIYRVNILTGESKRIQENDRFANFVTDEDYRVRFAVKNSLDGGWEYFQPGEKGEWTPFMQIGPEDSMTTHILDFDKTGRNVYLADSRGRDKAALFTLNLDTQEKKLLAEDARTDIMRLLVHPTEKTLQAYATTYERVQWHPMETAIEADFKVLQAACDGDISIVSRTLDDRYWIAVYDLSDGPVKFYLYDRQAKQARFLFVHNQQLAGLKLARMHPVVIKSRDGLDLVSYLTLPSASDREGRPPQPLPLVLNVHGGPWHRDGWGYNPEHQWLANRGYAVLSVNYRGSTGFGKNFINASDREWAGKMHDDLIDAVNWAVAEKITDPKQVAILGWSYGGYATLVGLTFTPDVFACGVEGVGISNLVTFMQTIPPYWMPVFELLTRRIGDPRTEEGREFLHSRSPLAFAERIKKPLLIGQGANDPRVKRAEADQIVAAMQTKGIPVTYALFPDEGHGFYRPENRLSFYAMAEIFLSQCLKGAYQPIGGNFKGSSVMVPKGAALLPGVTDALPKTP